MRVTEDLFHVANRSKSFSELFRPDITIDYDIKTYPFSPDFYLRKRHLELLTSIAENGTVVEIVGDDGAGKSTTMRELARYNKDQGKSVTTEDVRHLLTLNRGPKYLEAKIRDGIQVAESEKKASTKVILVLDSGDELWTVERKHGLNLPQLRQLAQRSILGADEARQLATLELKESLIHWIASNKDKVAIFLSAHSDESPSVQNWKDTYLRSLLEKIQPHRTKMLFLPYAPEEADALLTHLSVTHPDLRKVIINISRNHEILKAAACMKINGVRLQEHLEKLGLKIGVPFSPVTQQSNEHSIRYWLELARQKGLIH